MRPFNILKGIGKKNDALSRMIICENAEEAKVCKGKGLPYLIWKGTDRELAAALLIRVMRRKYPGVDWDEVLGLDSRKRGRQVLAYVPGDAGNEATENDPAPIQKDNPKPGRGGKPVVKYKEDPGSDIATGTRTIANASVEGDVSSYEEVDLEAYAEDEIAKVNLDKLQELDLLPSFLGDIYSCVKRNLLQSAWEEGWTKKLGAPLGNYRMCGGEGSNLIILDVSRSIPLGISSTMLTMIDTMRSKIDADLIVTGGCSKWFGKDDELPSPKELRAMIPRNNESEDFNKILRKKVSMHDWDNVIAFGDYDTPRYEQRTKRALSTVKVGKFWHYHTSPGKYFYRNDKKGHCGYARWEEYVAEVKEVCSLNSEWCSVIIPDHR